jgi:hypothetical protein
MNVRSNDMKLRSGKKISTLPPLHPSSSTLLAEAKKKEQQERLTLHEELQRLRSNPRVHCCISSDEEFLLPLQPKTIVKKKKKFARSTVVKPKLIIIDSSSDSSSDSPCGQEEWRSTKLPLRVSSLSV